MAATKYPQFTIADLGADLIARLVAHIEKGSTPLGAARLEGIPVHTFRKWRTTGKEQIELAYDTGERKFAIEREALMVLAVEQATARIAQRLGKQVQNGHEEWRSKLAWLERQERDDFAPTETIDVTVGGKDGAPIAVEGRAVVGLADVVRLALETGQGHLLGLGDAAGAVGGLLPAARDVLPDPADGEPAARAVSADID